MGLLTGRHELTIEASPQQCFEVVTDFESYPAWNTEVKEAEVLKRDKDGLPKLVELHVDVTIKKVTYQLQYEYDQPELMSWTYAGGEIKDFFGSFHLDEVEGGATSVTYDLSADPGFWTPPGLAKKLHGHALKRGLESLKKQVEQRH